MVNGIDLTAREHTRISHPQESMARQGRYRGRHQKNNQYSFDKTDRKQLGLIACVLLSFGACVLYIAATSPDYTNYTERSTATVTHEEVRRTYVDYTAEGTEFTRHRLQGRGAASRSEGEVLTVAHPPEAPDEVVTVDSTSPDADDGFWYTAWVSLALGVGILGFIWFPRPTQRR